MYTIRWRTQKNYQVWMHCKPNQILIKIFINFFIKIGCAAGQKPRRMPELRYGWVHL
jgi:hypothetical protein